MVNNLRKNIVFCIIGGLLAGIMLFVGFVVPKLSSNITDINQTEIEATVVEITKKEKDYLISLAEYNCKLFVDADSLLNETNISMVSPGRKVFFRLVETEKELINNLNIEQIFVVTLRTETEDIVTLDSYYDKEEKARNNIRTICTIATIACIGLLFYNVLIIISKSKNQKT